MRRPFASTILALALAAGLSGIAVAQQAWPSRQPIRVIIPFPAGSALDALGRPIFEQVGKQLGQTFVFENKPGAGGTLGMAQVAKAEPDGYTLLLNSSIQTIVPTTFATLPFDTFKDFAAIVPIGQFPNVLVTPPGRFASVQDMVAKAKAKPNSLSFGSGGIGAATHLNAERFRLAAGFEAVHVPFKGAPDAVREVLGGRIDFYFSPMAAVLSLIEGKKLEALAVSTLKRDSALPDVPTTLEAGYPNSDYIFWIGLFAPSGVPKEIVQRLHDETAKVLADPAMAAQLKKLGANPMPLTPPEFERFLRAELDTNAALIKAAGLKPN
jgi:tripartite-type tricarboxylate transporter receptor subunit TctC